MQVVVNGETVDIISGCTVSGLLEHLEIGRERVAVEVNRDIVPRANHDAHLLADGDRIEIVRFVGGG